MRPREYFTGMFVPLAGRWMASYILDCRRSKSKANKPGHVDTKETACPKKLIFFHSSLHPAHDCWFESKEQMKYHFLKGLSFVHTQPCHTYAQVTKHGLQKNAGLHAKTDNPGSNSKLKKNPSGPSGTVARTHQVTMCNVGTRMCHNINSESNMVKKQLIGDSLIRASTLKKAKSSGDFSVPLQNRFAALSVEPCMEDGTLVDIEDNARAFNSKNESLLKNTEGDIKKSGTLISPL